MNRLSRLLLVASLAAPLAGCKKTSTDSDTTKGSGDMASRVASLEAEVAKFREVAEFVRPVMEQQKAEAKKRAAMEPDPAARFAVAIDGSPTLGPETAAVTVIEAFDFA